MRHLFQTSELKQLELTELLLKQTDFLPIADLCKRFDISPITLNAYLKEICKNMPYIHEIRLDNEVKLEIDLSHGINDVYAFFLSHNLSFAILNSLFFKGESSFYELSQNLYTSESSIYRALKSLNKSFQQRNFDFQLSQKPTAIVGDEIDIRAFYCNFLFELYNSKPLPLDAADRDFLTLIMDRMVELNALTHTYPVYDKFSLMIAVNLFRASKGFRIQAEKIRTPDLTIWGKPEIRAHISRILGKPEDDLSDEDCSDFFTDILFPFYHKPIAHSMPEFLDKSINQADYSIPFHWLGHQMLTLERKYDIKFSSINRLFFKLHSLALLGRQFPASYPIIHQPMLDKISFVREWTPCIWQDIETMTDTFLKEVIPNSDPSVKQILLLIQISHITNYIPSLIEHHGKIKILIISEIDSYHAQSIRNIFSVSFPDTLDFHTADNHNLNLKDIEHSDFDIILSDFPIAPIPNKKVLRMDYIPSQQDLIKLIQLVNEVRQSFYMKKLK